MLREVQFKKQYLCLFFCVCLFITKIRARGYTIQVTFKWLMLLQLFLDNSGPAMSKTSLDFVFFKIWRSGTFFAFSPLYLSEPLRKQKFVVCDLWLVDFDPFCVFLFFKVLCFVFQKHRKFYRSSKFFFVFFGLKHGKFRFPRWNCSYRASTSRGNTDTEGWKGTGTFQPTFTFAEIKTRWMLR